MVFDEVGISNFIISVDHKLHFQWHNPLHFNLLYFQNG